MQSQVSKTTITDKFLIEKRGFNKLLILFPGFAFDYKIFSFLDLPFDYLYPSSLVTIDTIYEFKERLPELSHRFSKFYLVGWSLGANLALSLYKEFPSVFEKLFLISIKKHYSHSDIKELISRLKRNHKEMLRDFYRRCFLGKKAFWTWFRKELEPSYLKNFSNLMLIRQLTYLENDYVNIPNANNITIFLGKRDIIAPLSELPEIPSVVKTIEFSNASHMPFLEPNFSEVFIKTL